MTRGIPAAAMALAAVTAWGGAALSRAPAAVLDGRAGPARQHVHPGPPSGAFRTGAANGIAFPTPSQPVEGFSALIAGRQRGEYLGLLDNGFGAKDNWRTS